MQRKKIIGAGITLFAVILGIIWLIPLIWLIGTAFSVPSFHMTLFPEEIALLLSAFSEDEMYNYNGLCDVRGDFTLYVRTKKGDGVSGSLQMNRITPEIEELFVGTGLFEE